MIVFITATVLVLVIFAIAQFSFTRDFQNLEARHAEDMAQRAEHALSDRIDSLDTLNHDYAFWDDTYDFVRDPQIYLSYIQTNFTETTLANCGLNFIFIIDRTGNVVYSRGYDLSLNTDLTVPDSLTQKLATSRISQQTSLDGGFSGILMLPEIPLIISSQPIVTSNGEGPVAGTMIMARFLDREVLTDLGDMILLPVTFGPINHDSTLSPDYQTSLDLSVSTTSHIIDAHFITGSVIIRDIEGQPAMKLSVVVPKDIYAWGITTTRYFFFTLLGLVLVATLVINILIGKIVTARVNRVEAYIDDVTEKGELSRRLPIKGNDELAHISKDMNSILQSLEESRVELKVKEKREKELQRVIETSVNGVIVTDLSGVITDINDVKAQLQGYSGKKELVGKKVTDLVYLPERTRFRNNLEESFITGSITQDTVTMLKKDGSSYRSEVHVIMLKEKETTPVGFIISSYDLSKEQDSVNSLIEGQK